VKSLDESSAIVGSVSSFNNRMQNRKIVTGDG